MIDNRKLYLVESKHLEDAGPILALWVQVTDKWVGFYDTVRPHQFMGKLERETPDGFIWHRIEDEGDGPEDLGLITFKVLTLEEFNKKVRSEVTGELPDFVDTEDLHEWYRRQFAQFAW